ncbi:dUTP diphosphatase [Acutalibacter muris]|uniref:dUTP diphosphatase n=1 Tax=Acutalibacter muris TaxID=1796620 RepID=UPI001C3F0243|nr:dUTP diphosphatase [Acutalibacter muris]MCI9544735.1 dUTP diphosphatase [Acutalibacter muris]
MEIPFVKLKPGCLTPSRQTAGSAGCDLCACIPGPQVLRPGEVFLVPLGFAAEIPQGYAGFVFSRSGLGSKRGVVVAQGVGVIDSDYRGEWLVPLRNLGTEDYVIEPGERIAQVVFLPAAPGEFVETGELSGTKRGQGGFGSTGC